ncbi:DUF362 domain-containing protein [Anaerovorax sp. IOR16]|uniref:DUF362 domain-containing protein n=1 Tax=Anaerovorax sp. IOR16 TaxID=2773458 RepID=UPI0019D21C70|nr:DUF362 domain-containing protein [Anaerovorax sp. IOR16]
MEKAKVYYTGFRTELGVSLLDKLKKLVKEAGIDDIDFQNKYAAIKIHFGEPGNLAYLRPNFSKVIADIVKENGGKPFLTDANTLYVGGRKNALDHLESAYENGYNPFTTGCHILIADGLKGTDETIVPINGEYIKEAKIGRVLTDADVIISMNHFKCHESTGMGGALKNLGMGGGSRAGKMEMHNSGKPVVSQKRCISCGACRKNCAHDAISFVEKKAQINIDRCVGCGRCIGVCPVDAIRPLWDEAEEILNKKIAEYAYAVIKEKPHFHITFLMDVSPFCDCHGENDMPIIPDVGMFASFDPVALDVCCADMANEQPVNAGSILEEALLKHRKENDCDCTGKCHCDYFSLLHPATDWKTGIDHAVKMGYGSDQYELIKVE